jgi:hypothetical protein
MGRTDALSLLQSTEYRIDPVRQGGVMPGRRSVSILVPP